MTQYFDLVIRCPACIAEGRQGGVPRQWYHVECGGRIQVGDNAYYKCTHCRTELHVGVWRYICDEHGSTPKPTSAAHIANAVSTAGQMTSIAGRQWLMSFLENLGEF